MPLKVRLSAMLGGEQDVERPPEYFSGNPQEKYGVSLIARHVGPEMADGELELLTADFVGNLLGSAVEIYDQQMRRSERWTYLVPVWVALVAGVFGLVPGLG